MHLRDGVKLIRGHKHNGSDYYLVDDLLHREFHIDSKFGGYLMGLKGGSDRKETYDQFLKQNKLTATDIAIKPKQPALSKLLSWPLDLFNPTDVLNRTAKHWGWLFGSAGFILLALLWIAILCLMKGSWNEFKGYIDQYHTATVYILFGLGCTKLLHELGHSAALIRNGAQVQNIGVVFIALFPLPKTLAHRTCVLTPGQKLQVALAGIYIEAWVAAICALLWLCTEDSSLRVMLHFLAVISFGMTATLNLLPLMKFDGYQALSALLDAPKLYENALSVFRVRVYQLAGKKAVRPLISTNINDRWLFLYGLAIFSWRITLPLAIATGSIAMLGRPGFFMAALAILVMLIKPGVTEFRKFQNVENEESYMIRKIILLSIALVFLIWLIVPMNHTKSYEGVIEIEKQTITAPVDGVLLFQESSKQVAKGAKLIQLSKRDIAIERDQYYATQAEFSERFLERDHLQKLSNAEIERSESIKDQQTIKATGSSYWYPEAFESIVSAGDKLGTLYGEKATIRAFLPSHQFGGVEYQVMIKVPGETKLKKIFLIRLSEAVNLKLLPEWLQLGYSNYLVYEADYRSATIEKVIDVYVKRKYSIGYEMLKKFFFRVIDYSRA